MREIKFRAWYKPDGIGGWYDVVGFRTQKDYMNMVDPDTPGERKVWFLRIADGPDKKVRWMEIKSRYCHGPFIVQFTGLRDKNGREIYEGDIVDDGSPVTNLPVRWQAVGGWYPFIQNHVLPGNCAVIGNIHENPELLKQREQEDC